MAVITEEEAREFINALSGTDPVVIKTILRVADAAVATHLGYPRAGVGLQPSIEAATHTLYLDGPADPSTAVGRRTLRLPVRPIITITSIFDDPSAEYDPEDEVAATDFNLFLDDGEIILKEDSTQGAWSPGRRAQRVIGSLGFSTVPDDIKEAAIMWVGHVIKLRSRHGQRSITQAGITVTSLKETMPDMARQLLNPYVLWTARFGF